MKTEPIKVAVTGGAGQIAYNLLFRIASGEMFGAEQPISLKILELPDALPALKGVCMELEDCAYPLLKELVASSDMLDVFEDVDFALLIGAKPRVAGMERSDLLKENGKIFIEQGKAISQVAKSSVKVLVVGNPCNTNGLIAMQHAPNLSRKNFFAMTRLDENRAKALLASKASVSVKEVSCVAIWGNHSITQVPDYKNALVKGSEAVKVIPDRNWFTEEWIPRVQKRGAEVLKARGKSSAASAANAIIDTVHSLITPTPARDWHSLAICSDGNPYGIEENLLFSFPCRTLSDGSIEIVSGLELDEDLLNCIRESEKELIEERESALAGSFKN